MVPMMSTYRTQRGPNRNRSTNRTIRARIKESKMLVDTNRMDKTAIAKGAIAPRRTDLAKLLFSDLRYDFIYPCSLLQHEQPQIVGFFTQIPIRKSGHRETVIKLVLEVILWIVHLPVQLTLWKSIPYKQFSTTNWKHEWKPGLEKQQQNRITPSTDCSLSVW